MWIYKAIPLICDKSVTTQILAFLSYCYRKKRVCRCNFNMYIVITQFAKLAAGEQLCRRCTHTKLYYFKTFKRFSWKITDFELWHCCGKWAIWLTYDNSNWRNTCKAHNIRFIM
jgi:hypothetical protein